MNDGHNCEGGHPVARLIAYVHRVTENLIADGGRRRARQPELLSLDDTPGGDGADPPLRDRIADPAASVEAAALAWDREAALQRLVDSLLAELSAQQAAILRLDMADEGGKDAHLAVLLGTTVATVRSQRKRARERLRQIVESRRAADPEVDELLSELLSGGRDA